MKNMNRSMMLLFLFITSVIIGLCSTSCSLEKRVSITTGRYDNSYFRYDKPNIEIETARDTIASYRLQNLRYIMYIMNLPWYYLIIYVAIGCILFQSFSRFCYRMQTEKLTFTVKICFVVTIICVFIFGVIWSVSIFDFMAVVSSHH